MFRKFLNAFFCLFLVGQTVSMESSDTGVFEKQYKAYGINYKNVFFPLDHPQWTPEKLPIDMQQKLHGWYFAALRLAHSSSEADILRKYCLLYSAGCLGHLLAAQQAASMLLNPTYNNIIPLITGYEMLEPEVAQWDIRRLNQAQTDNKELAQVLKKVEELLGNEKLDSSSANQNIPIILQDLNRISQTVEVQGIKIFLSEIQEHIRQGGSFEEEDFKPLNTLAFIQGQGVEFPIFNHLLGFEGDEYSQESVTLKTLNFNKILNDDFVVEYADTLAPIIYNISPHPKHQGMEVRDFKFTSKARDALKKYIALKRVAILLGSDDTHLPSIVSSFDAMNDVEGYQAAFKQYKPLEDRINTFLGNLILTREATNEAALEILSTSMTNYVLEGGSNHERFKRLKEQVYTKKYNLG